MRTVTFDTNVYISALNFSRGKPKQLLQLAMDGVLHVAISDAIMQEVLRVMREKFHATPEALQEAEAIICACTERVIPSLSARTADTLDGMTAVIGKTLLVPVA